MAERNEEESSAEIELDEIVLAGIERGLTYADIKTMQIGQVVDFCISYNDRQKQAENENKKATQEDIDNFFGR